MRNCLKTGLWMVIPVICLITGNLMAQEGSFDVDPVHITLKARIISFSDGMPVPYAHVINNRTHSGTTSNSVGIFSMEMLNIDSLVISAMGFGKQVVKVPFNFMGDTIFVIRIKPVNYAIGEVTVTGDKQKVNLDGIPVGKPVDIDPKLRGDAFNERPPVLASLINPISYWQYYLSRREIHKRKARKAMALEKNWEMHSKNYNKQLVMKLTGLNDTQAEEFMIWFNAQDVLPYTATEYEVRASIRSYFQLFRMEKGFRD